MLEPCVFHNAALAFLARLCHNKETDNEQEWGWYLWLPESGSD